MVSGQIEKQEILHDGFSHGQLCDDRERLLLENRFKHLFVRDERFNRKVVSFQGNKQQLVHRWIKYRESFSSVLVETLLEDFNLAPGGIVLDPFAGSATTLLVGKMCGINATGIEILPNCHLAWQAKSKFAEYDLAELKEIYDRLLLSTPGVASKPFPHSAITEFAFPPEAENAIMWYTDWFANLPVSENAKLLARLIQTSILEDVSYTKKDGAFLRWDYRSEKQRRLNNARLVQGKKPSRSMDKGPLPSVLDALVHAFSKAISDIGLLQAHYTRNGSAHQELIRGSTLEILPVMPENKFSAVITSPPYLNRYDYTRTYALELAYLGCGDELKTLRQSLLSSTVESRSKNSRLENYYRSIGQEARYSEILSVINQIPVLDEINSAMKVRWDRGDLNNKGVLTMVDQYFSELAFVFAEIYRTTRSGAHIAFVNDNVRYGGEIIPVDTITTCMAEAIGFEPEKIIVLDQKKGNSNQQMSRYGRTGLRKCITVWKRP